MSKFHIAKCKLSVETEIVDDASYVPELAGQWADVAGTAGTTSHPVTCGVPLWCGCVSLGGNTAGRPSLLQPLKPVRQELLSISDYAGCSNHKFYHLQPILSLNTVLTVKEGRLEEGYKIRRETRQVLSPESAPPSRGTPTLNHTRNQGRGRDRKSKRNGRRRSRRSRRCRSRSRRSRRSERS